MQALERCSLHSRWEYSLDMGRAAVSCAVLAVAVYIAGLIVWTQRGTCVDADPIPDCTNDGAQSLFYISVPVSILLLLIAAALGIATLVRRRRRG